MLLLKVPILRRPIKCRPVCNMKTLRSTGFCSLGEDILFVETTHEDVNILFVLHFPFTNVTYNRQYLLFCTIVATRWHMRIKIRGCFCEHVHFNQYSIIANSYVHLFRRQDVYTYYLFLCPFFNICIVQALICIKFGKE